MHVCFVAFGLNLSSLYSQQKMTDLKLKEKPNSQ